jgi:uncharacterized protein YrrD
MFRVNNFLMMDVVDENGKKLGNVIDIALNMNENKIDGFVVSLNGIRAREVKVKVDNVIVFDKIMVVKEYCMERCLKFKEYKNTDVINIEGKIIGVLNDILYDSNYNIKGLIVSPGIFNKITRGKRIILPDNVIFGEKNILCFDCLDSKICLYSLRHSIMVG